MADEVAEDFYWISDNESFFAHQSHYKGYTRHTRCGIVLGGYANLPEMLRLAEDKPRCYACMDGTRA
ncbi:hypothetical protein ACFY7C_19345 [Streptomyces sp. NPDC012769]|uniref:hypothetical protein n=1 Tax=Streptomyces sp. NPDC012769 TaxID=3364848 RepID=UPI0036C47018